MTLRMNSLLAAGLVIAGCTFQSAAALAGQTGDQACAAYFSELHDAVLGTVRGTEHVFFTSHVANVSESTHGAGAKVPSFTCESGLKSLRKARKADSSPARTLGPACKALVEHIDNDCLKPLKESGKSLSDSCAKTLYGLSNSRDDLDAQLADDDFCKS